MRTLYWWLWSKFHRSKVSVFSNISFSSKLLGDNLVEKDVQIKKSVLGRFTYVAHSSLLDRVKIGSFCSIGPHCLIGLSSHPIAEYRSSHPIFYSKQKFWFKKIKSDLKNTPVERISVDIGNDVWVGASVLVLDGVKIGDGAVIAAGAVVVKDCEPFGVYAGVPAKLIKFKKGHVSSMQAKWWEWDVNKIADNWGFFNV
jgi:acetyltransferase-like isoleucine patch superfamily enzyme